MATAVVRNHGEGQALWMLNGLYEVKASGEETGGELTAMEITVPEGSGPPPHIHSGGEAVYVIEGRLRYHIAERTYEAGPGAFFYIPEGTLERFEPVGGAVRVLSIYTPGGIDKFFTEAGEPARAREIPPASDAPPDVARLMAIGSKYGLELRPPAVV
jgi:quercetin dioxygenase-like cupin family protein